MAQYAATNDTMFQGYLEPEQAQDYFAEVEKTSIVQQVARKIPLGPTGVVVPHWTGDVKASWVEEGGKKPVTKGDMTKQSITPHKIATIFAASAEVVRANPANYLGTMRTKVAEAIALAFDAAVLNGTNTQFGAYVGQTTKSVNLLGDQDAGEAGAQKNEYLALNNALSLLVNDGKKLTATLFDDVAEPILNGAVDKNGRPLFIDSPVIEGNEIFRSGRVLGRPSYLSDHVASGTTVGYAGDFRQIVWGQVGGLSFDVSDQATLELDGELVSLWQHNLVAVRVEAEFGALVNDPQAFVKLTNA
ncbi:hypothetical protein N806_31215 [Rhodococcus sp. P27]|nr:hypothetical protein N806_31215 [Rhodococcus sp. P27]